MFQSTINIYSVVLSLLVLVYQVRIIAGSIYLASSPSTLTVDIPCWCTGYQVWYKVSRILSRPTAAAAGIGATSCYLDVR